VVVLFNLLQQMETWLHQHIFKVGWLVTKNFQTTTILYYTFFLPGVVLYELVIWMMAGVLDVRAEGAVAFPEKQEIAELNLNFIKLHKRAAGWKTRIINNAPPFVGLAVIYIIALNVYNIGEMIAAMQPGTLEAFGEGIGRLLTTADFVIWTYVVFTISNVTIPNHLVIRGWRSALTVSTLVIGGLLVIGLADEVYSTIMPPIVNGLNALSTIFLLLIGINAAVTVILSAIENTIERITGDSATFKNGKLIAMKRAEILAQREAERQKALKAQQQKKQRPALPAGPPTIYRMPLPIPGSPNEISVTKAPDVIIAPTLPEAAPEKIERQQPSVIEGVAAPTPSILINPPRGRDTEPDDIDEPDEDSTSDDDSAPLIRISPPRTLSMDEDEDEEDYDDDDEGL
jgi:hypothetical protein